jgi:hypothetical protein
LQLTSLSKVTASPNKAYERIGIFARSGWSHTTAAILQVLGGAFERAYVQCNHHCFYYLTTLLLFSQVVTCLAESLSAVLCPGRVYYSLLSYTRVRSPDINSTTFFLACSRDVQRQQPGSRKDIRNSIDLNLFICECFSVVYIQR